MDSSYEGFYGKFDTPSKKVGSMLMGADNLVGDDYSIEFRNEAGTTKAWLKNKFDAEIGYFDAETTHKLLLAKGREQKIRAILSYVAYSDEPDPGHYWGEMALFCFNPAYAQEMDSFVDRVASKMKEGVRPNITLGSSSVEKIFSEPEWLPSDTVPLLENKKGTAVLKSSQSISEKMIEQGRARNKGCYVVSWAFIIIVVLAIAYLIAHLAGVI